MVRPGREEVEVECPNHFKTLLVAQRSPAIFSRALGLPVIGALQVAHWLPGIGIEGGHLAVAVIKDDMALHGDTIYMRNYHRYLVPT